MHVHACSENTFLTICPELKRSFYPLTPLVCKQRLFRGGGSHNFHRTFTGKFCSIKKNWRIKRYEVHKYFLEGGNVLIVPPPLVCKRPVCMLASRWYAWNFSPKVSSDIPLKKACLILVLAVKINSGYRHKFLNHKSVVYTGESGTVFCYSVKNPSQAMNKPCT